jgi:hypothetical protein
MEIIKFFYDITQVTISFLDNNITHTEFFKELNKFSNIHFKYGYVKQDDVLYDFIIDATESLLRNCGCLECHGVYNYDQNSAEGQALLAQHAKQDVKEYLKDLIVFFKESNFVVLDSSDKKVSPEFIAEYEEVLGAIKQGIIRIEQGETSLLYWQGAVSSHILEKSIIHLRISHLELILKLVE